MPSTTINNMTTLLNPPSVPATDISLREFVVDEDAENFNAALWRTIDQNAFILAQRDALEAFNVAKALRLSKETAAVELERRNAAPVTAPALPLSTSTRYQSQPIAIKKAGATPHPQPLQHSTLSDEAIARSLPRTSHTQVDASQFVHETRSSPSSSALPVKSIKNSSSYHQQDKKAPASIAKRNSRNQLSLSTSSFPTSSSPSTAVDSRHSRSTSQSNTFTKVPSLLPSIPPAGDQRALSKRDPGVTDEPTASTSSQFQALDATHPKRRRTERKPSLDVVVAAPPLSAPQKSSTFSRNLRPGTIIPPTQHTPSSSMSSDESKSLPPTPPTPAPAPKKVKVPKQKAYLHNPFNDLQICPQCGNRLNIPHIQVNYSSISSRLVLLLILLF
jgi:hypothetical protein